MLMILFLNFSHDYEFLLYFKIIFKNLVNSNTINNSQEFFDPLLFKLKFLLNACFFKLKENSVTCKIKLIAYQTV